MQSQEMKKEVDKSSGIMNLVQTTNQLIKPIGDLRRASLDEGPFESIIFENAGTHK